MDQHAEAVAVSREDEAFDADKFGEIVEAHCTPDAVEFDEEAPTCKRCERRLNGVSWRGMCWECQRREQKDAAQVASLRAELEGGGA